MGTQEDSIGSPVIFLFPEDQMLMTSFHVNLGVSGFSGALDENLTNSPLMYYD